MDHAQPVAHAPLHHHRAGHVRRLLNIACGSAGDISGNDFFRDAAGHHHGDRIQHLLPAAAENISFGQCHRRAERLAARDDRHFVERMSVLEHDVDQCVAGFVPSGELFVLISHREAAAFAAPADFVSGFLELFHADRFLVCARGQQRGFVEQIRQLSA